MPSVDSSKIPYSLAYLKSATNRSLDGRASHLSGTDRDGKVMYPRGRGLRGLVYDHPAYSDYDREQYEHVWLATTCPELRQ